MSAWLLSAAVCLPAFLLLGYAGVTHLRQPSPLVASLRGHRLLPASFATRQVVALWGAVEVLVGVSAAGGVLFPNPLAVVPLTVTGLVYLGYGCYLAVVRLTRGPVPCACTGRNSRATGPAVLRAFLLASAIAAHLAVVLAGVPRSAADALGALLGGLLGFGLLLLVDSVGGLAVARSART